MSGSRRLVPLLAALVLAVVPAGAQAQGGAGDDQYQDPFAGEEAPARERAQTPDSGDEPGLSEEPPTPAPSAPAPTPAPEGGETAPGTPTPPAAATGLPNTGFEVPGLALLGLGLLLSGLGLRLRTVDDSLF
jgi:LPXTG-motif cell wall-anchored protein